MAESCKDLFSNAFYYSSISFSLLLAKESGIFSSLLAATKPLTALEIADGNRIRERYVREILGCLSGCKVVQVATNQDGVFVYDLEAEAKQFLSKGASIAYVNFVKILMTRYADIKSCLSMDNPAVARYNQEYYDGVDEMREKTDQGTIDFLLEKVPQLKEKLEAGIHVLECGCGRASILSALALRFPASTFTASEVRPHLVDKLQQRLGHISNMRFELLDLCALPCPVPQRYDWVFTNDVLHDLPHPAVALKGIRQMVKGDGICTFIDPAGTGSHIEDSGDLGAACLYSLSTFLCVPESFQSADSEAHGACWGKDTALTFMRDAGFDTYVEPLEGKMCLFIAKPL